MDEYTLKKFEVTAGPIHEPVHQKVLLNGVMPEEALTPKLATRAALVAFGHRDGVTVWSNDDHGYRLYENSARKLYRE